MESGAVHIAVPRAAMTSILSWKQDAFLDACYEDKLFLYSPAEAAFSIRRFGADGLEPLGESRPLPLQNASDAYFYGFYDGRLVPAIFRIHAGLRADRKRGFLCRDPPVYRDPVGGAQKNGRKALIQSGRSDRRADFPPA